MEVNDVIARIKSVVPDVIDIEVDGADCNFAVIVVSDAFEGMLPVKRQQLVLSGFSELLASGELHALSVKAKTLKEINNTANQSAGLTQLQF